MTTARARRPRRPVSYTHLAVDHLGAHYGLTWLPETGETYQLRFAIMKDLCEVFLDSSGVSLHKRGYRAVGNEEMCIRDSSKRESEKRRLERESAALAADKVLRRMRVDIMTRCV